MNNTYLIADGTEAFKISDVLMELATCFYVYGVYNKVIVDVSFIRMCRDQNAVTLPCSRSELQSDPIRFLWCKFLIGGEGLYVVPEA